MSYSDKYLQLLRQAQTIVPDQLPPDFPYSEFQYNLTKYNEHDSWYNGTKLDDTLEVEGKEIKKYPVRINPIKGTCLRHVAMLFGDINNSDQILVTPRTVKKPGSTQEEKDRQLALEEALIQIWYENNGRDLQLNNGLISQRNGGCVFYVKYDPFSSSKMYPISIEAPSPKFFIGVPNSSNPYDLEEAWIIKPISAVELRNQGIVGYGLFGLVYDYTGDDVYWLVEHYTKRIYEVFVNGKKIGRRILLPSGAQEVVQVGGENKPGIVPIVYIPHIRNTSNFYGDNVFDNVVGLVLEMNARVADFGDAVSMDSHDIIATKNVNGPITVSQLVPGVTRVDLGSGINVTGQEAQPDATSLRKSSMASSAMEILVKDVLYKQYRRDAIHPAVCDGEDEGSQRSSQTLTTRMWALETHAEMERVEWTAGLNVLAKIIIKTLATYAPEKGIDESFLQYRLYQAWYPTLQKDRTEMTTEIATRVGAKILSPERAMEMSGDIEDVEEEKKQIFEFWKTLAEMMPQQNQGFGNPNPVSQKSNQKK